MIIVLIRRCVRLDKEEKFLADYNRETPTHPDFIEETLTKISDATMLPEPMRSLPLGGDDCVTYLNIARWKSVAGFQDHFHPETTHDPEIEVSDRLRVVLDVVS